VIELVPLCEMKLKLAPPIDIGQTPNGHRMIAEAIGAQVTGRIAGSLAGTSSADWITSTAAGHFILDVRLAIRTDDDAVIMVTYGGRMRYVEGTGLVCYVAPLFETGDPRYGWLNEIQAVGKGLLSDDLTTLSYEDYEVR
jgi:Protein of unknown function (DUF3237)